MVLEGWVRRNRAAGRSFTRAMGRVGLSLRSVEMISNTGNRIVLWTFLILLGALVNSPDWDGAMVTWSQIGALPWEIAYGRTGLAELGIFPMTVLAAIIAVEIYEWLDSRQPVFERLAARGRVVSWGFYYVVAGLIIMFGSFSRSDFIYFNF